MEEYTAHVFRQTALSALQAAQNVMLEARLRKKVDARAVDLMRRSFAALPELIESLRAVRAESDPGYTGSANSDLDRLYKHVIGIVNLVSARLPAVAAAVAAGSSGAASSPARRPGTAPAALRARTQTTPSSASRSRRADAGLSTSISAAALAAAAAADGDGDGVRGCGRGDDTGDQHGRQSAEPAMRLAS